MRFSDTLRRSSRSLRSAKIRTLLTAAALAVGGFTLTATLGAANGARAYTDRLVASNFDPSSLTVAKDKSLFGGNGGGASNKPQQYDPSLTSLGRSGILVKQLTTADINKIKAVPGVESVIPNYQLNAQYITRAGAAKYTGTISVYNPDQKPELVAGAAPHNLPSGKAFLPESYVALLGFTAAAQAINQPISITVQQFTGKTQTQTFTIAGVTTKPATSLSLDSSQILLNNDDAAALNAFVNNGTVSANKYLVASVHVKNGTDPAQLKKVKTAIEKLGYAAQTVADTQKLLSQVITILQSIVLGFGVITLIASFFGVVNTQYISVLERTREIGLMKALGMSRRSVSLLFVVEATWIGFIGALLGSVVAIAIGSALNPWISQKLSFGNEHLLIFKPLQIVILIAFLMLITTVAGLLPARKAARLDPIEALRTD
jgi:putative ABC transport system permease protein